MSRKRRVYHLGLWGPKVDEGVDWEIDHHLQERIDELIANGLTRDEAEAEARRAFGDVTRVRRELHGIDHEIERRLRIGVLFDTIVQDVRYGARGLMRTPAFAIAIVLTLGLGIGANVALFTVLDALIFRPLPFAAPEELYVPWSSNPRENGRGTPYYSWEDARQWLERGDFFTASFAHTRASVLYVGGAEPVTLPAEQVTHTFEETLGVHPILGRGFLPEDAAPGAARVVLLDHNFWKNALGADPAVVNRTIELEGSHYNIIGVMPEGFKYPTYSTTEFWLPIANDGTGMGRPLRNFEMVGRIPTGQLAAAQVRLGAFANTIAREKDPESELTAVTRELDALRMPNGNGVEALWLLGGAVVFILLVAGVNMVNLLLVRGTARARELAVRVALGASRGRIVRQLATEAMIVALVSGVAAVLIALVALRSVAAIMPDAIAFWAPYTARIEERALLFTFVLTAASGFAFGLMPAVFATRRARADATADLTRYAARTRGRSRLRKALVVVEAALSVMLLIGAALLINSFVRLMKVDPGFEPDNLAVMTLSISSAAYPTGAARGEYLRRVEESIEAVPGVTAAVYSGGLPPSSNITFATTIDVPGRETIKLTKPLVMPSANVRPEFFDVLGAKLLSGRPFAVQEDPNSVIIDQDFARYLWPDANPLGQRFRFDSDAAYMTVVGVMQDLKLLGPGDRYSDYEFVTPLGSHDQMGSYLSLAIRTRTESEALLPALRAAVHRVDARQPIEELTTARAAYATSVDLPRFLLVLMSTLAGIALALAGIGLYGVLSYGITQRAHELAVRMALGARAAELGRRVVGEGVMLAGIGVLIGLAGAMALVKFIRGVLFGVQPADPLTLTAVAATMLVVALIASANPARRATRVAPGSVLRSD